MPSLSLLKYTYCILSKFNNFFLFYHRIKHQIKEKIHNAVYCCFHFIWSIKLSVDLIWFDLIELSRRFKLFWFYKPSSLLLLLYIILIKLVSFSSNKMIFFFWFNSIESVLRFFFHLIFNILKIISLLFYGISIPDIFNHFEPIFGWWVL